MVAARGRPNRPNDSLWHTVIVVSGYSSRGLGADQTGSGTRELIQRLHAAEDVRGAISLVVGSLEPLICATSHCRGHRNETPKRPDLQYHRASLRQPGFLLDIERYPRPIEVFAAFGE